MSEIEIEAIIMSKDAPIFTEEIDDDKSNKENAIPNKSGRRLAESMFAFLQRQTQNQIERIMKREVHQVTDKEILKFKQSEHVIKPFHEQNSKVKKNENYQSQKKEMRSTYKHVSYSPVRNNSNGRSKPDVPPLHSNVNISRIRGSYEGNLSNSYQDISKEYEHANTEDYYRTKLNHILYTEKQKYEQEKNILELKITDLMKQIVNQQDYMSSLGAPDQNLLDRNAYLSTELEKN